MDDASPPHSLAELPADGLLLILDQIHNAALLAVALSCAAVREAPVGDGAGAGPQVVRGGRGARSAIRRRRPRHLCVRFFVQPAR